MPIDLRVAELMCSRLCHDLVSPIGAINNGVELIEELGEDASGEAMTLVSQSAQRAAALLRCFRLTYGAAGAQPTSGLGEARDVALGYLSDGKVRLDWPSAGIGAGPMLPPGTVKLALALVMLAAESLVYGGVVRVETEPAGRGNGSGLRRIVVAAEGRGATLGDEEIEALEGRGAPEALTPRTVHAYAAGAFSRNYGIGLAHDRTIPGRLRLSLELGG